MTGAESQARIEAGACPRRGHPQLLAGYCAECHVYWTFRARIRVLRCRAAAHAGSTHPQLHVDRYLGISEIEWSTQDAEELLADLVDRVRRVLGVELSP